MMFLPSLLLKWKGENMKKQRLFHRLNLEDRMLIQACLLAHMNITDIAFRVHVHKSTISRELKNNSVYIKGINFSCTHKENGLCNGCTMKQVCRKEKIFYDFKEAQLKSQRNRSTPRSKPKTNEETIKYIDEVVTQGVLLGQSLHHIYVSDPKLKYFVSEQTIRRLCYRNHLRIKPFQLRRYVRYRRSYKKEIQEIKLRDIRVLIGRTNQEFLKRIKAHPKENIVQYDSVIGKREDKKALLTIAFPKYAFQFGYLINKGSPSSTLMVLNRLFKILGKDVVKKIFPIIFADNGTEFSYFHQIEEMEKEKVCSTYFTSPYKATNKAECERYHELVRYCLPKGHSLDTLTQEKVDEMFSNINSYTRKSKGDQTPYDIVKRKFGKEFLDKIGIYRVAKKKVRLLPIV